MVVLPVFVFEELVELVLNVQENYQLGGLELDGCQQRVSLEGELDVVASENDVVEPLFPFVSGETKIFKELSILVWSHVNSISLGCILGSAS